MVLPKTKRARVSIEVLDFEHFEAVWSNPLQIRAKTYRSSFTPCSHLIFINLIFMAMDDNEVHKFLYFFFTMIPLDGQGSSFQTIQPLIWNTQKDHPPIDSMKDPQYREEAQEKSQKDSNISAKVWQWILHPKNKESTCQTVHIFVLFIWY